MATTAFDSGGTCCSKRGDGSGAQDLHLMRNEGGLERPRTGGGGAHRRDHEIAAQEAATMDVQGVHGGRKRRTEGDVVREVAPQVSDEGTITSDSFNTKSSGMFPSVSRRRVRATLNLDNVVHTHWQR